MALPNVVLEKSLKRVGNENRGDYLIEHKFNILVYVDKVMLLGETDEDIKHLFRTLLSVKQKKLD